MFKWYSCYAAVRVANRSGSCYTCGVKFRVTIEPDEDGVFVAECPALPGCISPGKTRDAAMVNIRDAIQRYGDSLKKHGDPIPGATTETVVEVTVRAVRLIVQAQMPPDHS